MRFLLLALLFFTSLLHAAEVCCWRLGGAAEPKTLRHAGFRLLLTTAEHSEGVLRLRVGLQNSTQNAAMDDTEAVTALTHHAIFSLVEPFARANS
jgi:hypothetical protein